MNVLGWILVGLMVGTLFQNLKTSRNATTRLGQKGPLIAAIVTVNIMSALDAVSTIYLIAQNHSGEGSGVLVCC